MNVSDMFGGSKRKIDDLIDNRWPVPGSSFDGANNQKETS